MSTSGLHTVYSGSRGGFDRTKHYEVFANFGTKNMFSYRSRHQHAARKRMIASYYAKSNMSRAPMQRRIRSRLARVVDFVRHQSTKSQNGKVVSQPLVIRHLFRAMEADIMTVITMSDAGASNLISTLDDGTYALNPPTGRPKDLFNEDERETIYFWESTLPFKYALRWICREAVDMHREAEKWFEGLIGQYERATSGLDEKQNSGVDFDCVYRRLSSNTGGERLDWLTRASEVMDHIVAGRDSVPASIEYTIQRLSKAPAIQERLREEIITYADAVRADPSFNTLDSLRYLDAVVLESLRLMNTLLSYVPRTVPKGGCVIEGHYLPAGTIISSHPCLMHAHPDFFPDANHWDPQRWLLDDEHEYKRLVNALWTFSSGSRACTGRDLAISIIKNVVFEVHANFKTIIPATDMHMPQLFQVQFIDVGRESIQEPEADDIDQ